MHLQLPHASGLQAFDVLLRRCAMVNTDDLKQFFGLFFHWLSP